MYLQNEANIYSNFHGFCFPKNKNQLFAKCLPIMLGLHIFSAAAHGEDLTNAANETEAFQKDQRTVYETVENVRISVNNRPLKAKMALNFIDSALACSKDCKSNAGFAIYVVPTTSTTNDMINQKILAWLQKDNPQKPLIKINCINDNESEWLKAQCERVSSDIMARIKLLKNTPPLALEIESSSLGAK